MCNLELGYQDEINWFIETYINDDFEDDEDKKVLLELTDEDKRDVVDRLLNDDEINSAINEAIRYYLFHRR